LIDLIPPKLASPGRREAAVRQLKDAERLIAAWNERQAKQLRTPGALLTNINAEAAPMMMMVVVMMMVVTMPVRQWNNAVITVMVVVMMMMVMVVILRDLFPALRL
jgi:hypothetical protein